MQGEYRGNFTRDTFDPSKRFSRVLMQQGRVLLDEDWNEQSAILLYYLRTLATDLIGPSWGPKLVNGAPNAGFVIGVRPEATKNFTIGPGRYYVEGVLCENSSIVTYTQQEDLPLPEEKQDLGTDLTYLVYLDVWERHITAFDDDSIREIALGGPDTSTRARIVWQIKVDNLTEKANSPNAALKNAAQSLINATAGAAAAAAEAYLRLLTDALLQPKNKGTLRVRVTKKGKPDEPCAISPESRYRGLENHLYRVEVHRTGGAWDGNDATIGDAATFKWSRDNTSTIFPLRSLTGNKALLDHLGRDRNSSLQIGDFVEVIDDTLIRRGEAGVLRQVETIDETDASVTLKDGPGTLPSYAENSNLHPLLRRWDHRDDGRKQSGLVLKEDSGETDDKWVALEDGIQIQFPTPGAGASTYRSGDYWLIPARVTSGNVEWPRDGAGNALAQPPHGIEHHYAPIWLISTAANGDITALIAHDFRHLLP